MLPMLCHASLLSGSEEVLKIALKIPLCSANRTTIHLTKRNFHPQFSAFLATAAILGQPPERLTENSFIRYDIP